jgi:2,4-dienoyl-CoA reductase (NADPH2)
MSDILFTPLKAGPLTLKNRIIMPAMHLNMSPGGEPSQRMIDFYAARARGGAALIFVGGCVIDEYAGGMMMLNLYKDEMIPAMGRLAKAIKEGGALAGAQLYHAGRYVHQFFLDGKPAISASAVTSQFTHETPREMSVAEIKQTVDNFAAAALRAEKAGFDSVELIGSAGYLISQFLSPLTNKRTDEYGGSFENRMRFGAEAVAAVKEAVGGRLLVSVRLAGNEFMEGGLSNKEIKQFAKKLEEAGAEMLNVTGGWHETKVPQILMNVPRAAYAYLARGIKESVKIPVVACNRISYPQIARLLLETETADLVGIARGLIADPEFPLKTLQGREDDIVHCIGCAQGCFDHVFLMQPVECMCNPRAGYEESRQVKQALRPKKVLVIGAGPAGLSAAVSAAESGHKVTIVEKSKKIGGQLKIAAIPPGRAEFREMLADLLRQAAKQEVLIETGVAADEALLAARKPDYVILASGAKPLKPELKGVDLPHVVQAWDVLNGQAITGLNCVVLGGGAVGVETALYLAAEGTLDGEVLKFLLVNKAETYEALRELAMKGVKQVTLLEMLPKIGKDIGRSNRWSFMQELEHFGVRSIANATAEEITPRGVQFTAGGERGFVEADTVVLALGAKSENSLTAALEELKIPYKIVGDAGKVADAFAAVHAGFKAGREV